ncbi:hypothetical protein K449DRAFT_389983 [Hypoxylon sp. EC38]|nr:hypothetical protein K449DRAFT_389983 [Hypoxylon sp. EC38]
MLSHMMLVLAGLVKREFVPFRPLSGTFMVSTATFMVDKEPQRTSPPWPWIVDSLLNFCLMAYTMVFVLLSADSPRNVGAYAVAGDGPFRPGHATDPSPPLML